ncbi:MAG: hypothetical protein AB8B50_18775 [Pirellulaceae bacterium]
MLFLVPLLAGFLKPVRVSVDKANNLIEKAKDETAEIRDIAEGAEALASMASKLASSEDESTNPQESAPNVTDSILWGFDWSLDNPRLPRPWAMAFAAALMLLTADTIYQLFCPAVVKKASCQEHLNQQCSQFATHPSQTVLARAKAMAAKDIESQDLLSQESSLLEQLQSQESSKSDYLLGELTLVRNSLVEASCRRNYLADAARNPLAAVICFIIYFAAACIVLKILQEQTYNVLRSAGWWDI